MNGYVQHNISGTPHDYVHYGAHNSVHNNNAQTIMHNNVQPHDNSEQIDGNWTIHPAGVAGSSSCDNNVIMNSEPTFFSPAVSQQGGGNRGTKIFIKFLIRCTSR